MKNKTLELLQRPHLNINLNELLSYACEVEDVQHRELLNWVMTLDNEAYYGDNKNVEFNPVYKALEVIGNSQYLVPGIPLTEIFKTVLRNNPSETDYDLLIGDNVRLSAIQFTETVADIESIRFTNTGKRVLIITGDIIIKKGINEAPAGVFRFAFCSRKIALNYNQYFWVEDGNLEFLMYEDTKNPGVRINTVVRSERLTVGSLIQLTVGITKLMCKWDVNMLESLKYQVLESVKLQYQGGITGGK